MNSKRAFSTPVKILLNKMNFSLSVDEVPGLLNYFIMMSHVCGGILKHIF